VHHKLYTPWLKPENCKAGLIGLRGTVNPAFGLMERHAKEIASLITRNPTQAQLDTACIEVRRFYGTGTCSDPITVILDGRFLNLARIDPATGAFVVAMVS
jgi:hypothetical protein